MAEFIVIIISLIAMLSIFTLSEFKKWLERHEEIEEGDIFENRRNKHQ